MWKLTDKDCEIGKEKWGREEKRELQKKMERKKKD
jgi:hypothetical protein